MWHVVDPFTSLPTTTDDILYILVRTQPPKARRNDRASKSSELLEMESNLNVTNARAQVHAAVIVMHISQGGDKRNHSAL